MRIGNTNKRFTIIRFCILSTSLAVLPNKAHTPYTIIQSMKRNEIQLQGELKSYLSKVNENVVLLRIFYTISKWQNIHAFTESLCAKRIFSGINALSEILNSSQTRFHFLENKNTIIIFKTHIVSLTSRYSVLSDFREASRSLAFLQRFYNLNITKLNDGEIQIPNKRKKTFYSFFKLNNFDALYIGIIALKYGWNHSGREWIHLADRAPYFLGKLLSKNLWYKEQIHSNRSFSRTGIISKRDEFHIRETPTPSKHFFDMFEIENDLRARNKSVSQSHNGLDSLCREETSSSTITKKLFQIKNVVVCNYYDYNNAYLQIGPFKTEAKSHLLSVNIFHDFLNPYEIAYLKQVGSYNMKASGVGEETGQVARSYRNSFTAWIKEKSYEQPYRNTRKTIDTNKNSNFSKVWSMQSGEKDQYSYHGNLIIHDVVAFKITKRIELASQLILDSQYGSEQYQIVNYGPGGRYETHVDVLGDEKLQKNSNVRSKLKLLPCKDSGDRLATFMVYLSKVPSGGSTYFPILKVINHVALGGALFWKNLFRDGKMNMMAAHGGCPVLLGSKWIANKWIFYHDNFQRLPCTLTSSDAYQEQHTVV